ncbi:probable lysophospholipase BODYGUARD 3 [Dendrobium catenatum]|uniref:Cardiolipin-specific phospholipase n=1 Tax=Dendrobium catenatum TaxID=906689 RepID=A0A2I0WBB3_9ASPA|nr:probable lysophospholipase BODYGUARD 3 [Dendrobium catenatum]PKU72948.1 cardiolipin-specific phospholipase [Dendrobium catenatum]
MIRLEVKRGGAAARSAVAMVGRLVNEVVSFVLFSALDLLDAVLCLVFKLVDYAFESKWKPCYCSSSAREMITSSGNILISESGKSKIVFLSSTKLHLEEISDTLYSRPPLLFDISRSTMTDLRSLGFLRRSDGAAALAAAATAKRVRKSTTALTINSAIVEMLQGKIGGKQSQPVPRWSDCACKRCSGWCLAPSSSRVLLYAHSQFPPDGAAVEDVLFIHGFISSSSFWTETVFPNFSDTAKSRYRLFAMDLLGFGRSPKPADSLYTLREHVDMIERSVLQRHGVRSFHIVAHSLGSILALALAVKYPDAVRSLTLLAPPYFPVPKGEQGTQYVLRRVAQRRVWPLISLGASVACWYEHISRTVSLLMCKHHLFWEFIFRFFTRNRIRTFLMEGFFCHTHNAAWHTLHNVICGTAGKIEGYLDTVRDRMPSCAVTILHGTDDDLLPVSCSSAVKARIPRADLRVIDGKDHITIVVGRQKAFARELELIWEAANLKAK